MPILDIICNVLNVLLNALGGNPIFGEIVGPILEGIIGQIGCTV